MTFLETVVPTALSPTGAIEIASMAIALFGLLFGKWWYAKQKFRPLESLPSPPKHWLLGNIPQIVAAVKAKKFFLFVFEWSQKLGSMYVLWSSPPRLILGKPHLIENILIQGMKEGKVKRSPHAHQIWNEMSGPVMIGQNNEEWQWRRKAWNPAFSPKGMSYYTTIINSACQQAIAQIRETPEVQVDPIFVELTMRAIACLVFGIPVDRHANSPEGENLDVEKIHHAISIITYRVLRLATGEKMWMKYLPTQNARDYWQAKKVLEDFLDSRVDLALKMRDRQETNLEGISALFQDSMLVKIAVQTPQYTRETLIAEAIELFIAGTETTAHALSFTTGELALHPEVFQKARSEVDRVWDRQGGITAENIRELAYTRSVFKETLRLYSIASGSTEIQATQDIHIENYTIPRGTLITWSMLAAGRDPEVYPNPDRFLPERWLEDGKDNPSIPSIVFGSGLHRCLGEHLSMVEATIMLALLIRHFDWELINGRSSLEGLQNLLIYPADGIPIRFQARTDL